MNKTQVIKRLIAGAQLSFKQYNTLPSVTIAQAILETGWLEHIKGNNIFGIKWTKDCGYEVQEFNTHEWINGVKTPMVAKFRKYNSLEGSILDHGKLLSFSRYRAVIESKDYKEASNNLYKSGYCTDYEYAQKLIAIIEENKLYLHDPVLRGNVTTPINLENTKYLQNCLNKMKIKDANNNVLLVDGINGPNTNSALKKFQRIVEITNEELKVSETLSAVQAIMKEPTLSVNSGPNKMIIRYLQYRVKSSIDGIYGDETKGHVKEYQKNNSLIADGIVGKETWGKLLA